MRFEAPGKVGMGMEAGCHRVVEDDVGGEGRGRTGGVLWPDLQATQSLPSGDQRKFEVGSEGGS